MLRNVIPPAQTPVINLRTGIMNRDWYRFFSELAEKVDGLQYTDIDDPNFVVLADAEAYCLQLVNAFRNSGLGD